MCHLKLTKPCYWPRRNLYWKIFLSFICIASFGILLFISQNREINIQHSQPDLEHFEMFNLSPLNFSNILHTNFTGRELDWQEITEMGGPDDAVLKTKFFVYSAYVDYYENEHLLRIVAVTPSHTAQKLYCHIFDKSMLFLGIAPGEVRTTLCPQNSLMYSAAYILCKLGTLWNTSKIPITDTFQIMKFVSVSPSSESVKDFLQNPIDPTSLSNILRITTPTKNDEHKFPHKFGLCVQPTFEYDKVFEFIQWMEFHKMMGVSHFTFYNISFGPRVSCVLKSRALNEETPVHILKWTVPITNVTLLHVNAQIAQGNDCAFRYRGVSKYLVFVDLDEVIIPNYVYAKNYDELIQVIDSDWKADTNGSGPIVAQYQFRGGYFGWDFGQFPPPRVIKRKKRTKDRRIRNKVELEDLTIYKYVTRQKKLFSYKERSKFITIPSRVIEPGVHSMDESVGDATELLIPFETAFLHHYRGYGCGNNCSFVAQEMDFTGHFFALKLLEKVRKMMEKLVDECDLGDAIGGAPPTEL